MADKVLTISIAAYNLSERIDQCLASFASSKFIDDIELIVTNDGSKDDTPKKVEKWVERYPNSIRLINKKNEGAGSTVNSGILHATGKYFKMVDGDDWVENIDEFVSFLKNCDSDRVVSDYTFYDNSKKAKDRTERFSLPKGCFHFDDEWDKIPNERHALCFKTEIRKSIHLDNGFYTDVEYLLFPLTKVKTVSYFAKPVYIYRVGQRNQSVSPQSRRKHVLDHEAVLSHVLSWLNDNKDKRSSQHLSFVLKRAVSLVDNQRVIYLLFKPSKEQKTKIKSFVREISMNEELYSLYKQNKKLKLLTKSHYLLYPLACRLVQRKEGR